MTVPAGYTSIVYDRGLDGQLLPGKPAVLPVGLDVLGLPFNEPKVFAIASAYQKATHHRMMPPEFPPLE